MAEIIEKQAEIIESLVWLDKKLISLLGQYTEVEAYEYELSKITGGDDVVI